MRAFYDNKSLLAGSVPISELGESSWRGRFSGFLEVAAGEDSEELSGSSYMCRDLEIGDCRRSAPQHNRWC